MELHAAIQRANPRELTWCSAKLTTIEMEKWTYRIKNTLVKFYGSEFSKMPTGFAQGVGGEKDLGLKVPKIRDVTAHTHSRKDETSPP